MIDLGLRTVELDDQQRLDVERIPGVHELLDCMDRRTVHHFHAPGNYPGADDSADAGAGMLGRREAHQHGTRTFRLPEDAHGDLGDDAEQSLGAGDDTEQVVAAGVEVLAAEPHDLAGDEHQLAAQQVIGGHAVFEAVHAARVLRHIAADCAGDLRGRIGGIVEAGMLDRLRDGEIGHARLDHRDAVGEVDLANAVELGHPEENAVGQRQRAAGKRGAGPARHHLDAFRVAECEHAADLLRRLRQDDHHGELSIGGEPIGLVGAHLTLGRDHPLPGDDGPERFDDALASGEHHCIGGGHCDRHVHAPWPARRHRLDPCL